jgi:beta-phosphoglucomutase-like phosphatase (HAD superfamily)
VYAGIPEALNRLQAAGCRLLVATAKPHDFAHPILEHFALAPRFTAIHGPELDGTRDAKVDLLAHIVAEHNLDVETAVMVGDRAFDLRAAHANGIAGIGAAWGNGSRAELEARGCDGHLRCARRPGAAGFGRGRRRPLRPPRSRARSNCRISAPARPPDGRGRRHILDTRGNRCFKVRAL